MRRSNVETVRMVIEEIGNKGRHELLDELYAERWLDHPLWHEPIDGDGRAVGDQPVVTTREHHRQNGGLRALFRSCETTIDQIFDAGERVVVVGTSRAEDLLGRRLTWKAMEIYRLSEGRVVEVWTASDRLGIVQQLGLVPTTQALWASVAQAMEGAGGRGA